MPSNLNYPPALETAWIQHAMRVTGARTPQRAVERLEAAAGSLSDAFTTGRDPDFAGYRTNRRVLAAYGLFFFPRAYMRTRLVLRECRDSLMHFPPDEPIRIVDLGAGTGAAGMAALQTLTEEHPATSLQLDMVDCAREGIDLSRSIFSAGRTLWPLAAVREIAGDARTYRLPEKADIILCSFALNEWMEQEPEATATEWLERLIHRLKPGGRIILLEPALRASVERMERLRDHVAAGRQARIIAPCPHHDPCPMLAQKRGWCHEVRTWAVPESLHWINRRLRRDVHLLKFSFLVLENRPPPVEPADWMRLVSPVQKQKGKFAYHGCGADGQLHPCEWLTRNLTPEQQAGSEMLERGDRVRMERGKLLGDGITERLDGPPRLTPHSNEP